MQEFENSPAPDHNQYVRKVTLPSGKTIEVISFEDLAPVETDIHVCQECSSELVYPVAWEEADRARWEVSLRCPNCEWRTTDVFEEEAIQRFVSALMAGHLLPEDF